MCILNRKYETTFAISNKYFIDVAENETSGVDLFLYSRETLSEEYFRDKNKGMETVLPYNYFPNNDPDNIPLLNWKCHANLMFSNWLNYCIYQSTPYDITELDLLNWEWEPGL